MQADCDQTTLIPRCEVMRDAGESAALVAASEGMAYTEEPGPPPAPPPPLAAPQHQPLAPQLLLNPVEAELARFHQDAIGQAGVARVQVLVLAVVGLALAADAVELTAAAYVTPGAEVEFCINDQQKLWLSLVSLVCSALGALIWGTLSDKVGRRGALLTAMVVTAVFSTIAALMPTYGTFMTARLAAALGVGGALPVGSTLLAELVPSVSRTRWIGSLVACWPLGGIYSAVLAWCFLPTTGSDVVTESNEHFSAWHRFLLLGALPSLAAAAVGFATLPESPRYLLAVGRDAEAIRVYQRIYERNRGLVSGGCGGGQYPLSELEVPAKRNTGGARPVDDTIIQQIIRGLSSICRVFFQRPITTLLLAIVWGVFGLSVHGSAVWAPSWLSAEREADYFSKTQFIKDQQFIYNTFNVSLENLQWINTSFVESRFDHVTLSHVSFVNCSLERVTFTNVRTSKVYFDNSIIRDSSFIDTDLSEAHFRHCNVTNITMLSPSPGCPYDLDYNIHAVDRLHEGFARHAGLAIGTLIGLVFLVTLRPPRRNILIASSLIVAVIPALLTALVVELGDSSLNGLLIAETILLTSISIIWPFLVVIILEVYSTRQRATALGAACFIARAVGAAFGAPAVGTNSAAVAIFAIVGLVFGAAVSLRLPDASSALL